MKILEQFLQHFGGVVNRSKPTLIDKVDALRDEARQQAGELATRAAEARIESERQWALASAKQEEADRLEVLARNLGELSGSPWLSDEPK